MSGRLVIGTAGHVDHGKTALVLALTGHDTDRLPEEKARGISIALGFAPLEVPGAPPMSLVDVPGHERFVRRMVSGASGVDAWLLAVAADDGVMPQTREHLDVLRLLGVAGGVVAVTRSDLADPAPAAAAARELVGPGPEIVAVAAPRGDGLPGLRAALARLAARSERRPAAGPARLFVDRAFTARGAGTVVTGTLWGGAVHVGDRVAVHPSGARGRVRAVQVHDAGARAAEAGRVALNLAGVARQAAPPGACVVLTGEAWEPAGELDVDLEWLHHAAGRPPGRREHLQAFLGTAEVPATLVLRPGLPARVRLRRPVLALPGDRLVLRGPGGTVGGGVVRGRPPAPAPAPAAPPAVPRAAQPPPPVDVAPLLALLRASGRRPVSDAALGGRAGAPAASVARALGDAGAVRTPGGWLAPGPAREVVAEALAALAERPLTLAELRDLWGVGRRHAEALAGHLDAVGATMRVGGRRRLRPGVRPPAPMSDADREAP